MQQLVDALAALVTGIGAFITARTGVELLSLQQGGVDPQLLQQHVRGLVRRLAVGADGAHQSLGEDADDGGGEQERLHPHVHKARHRAGGVVRVQCGEHQVARQCGLNGDLGRVFITNFPHQNAVRVLTQEGAQHARERDADTLMDGHLHNAVDVVFHRVLGCQHLGIDGIHLAQCGVERGRLTRARGAGDHENAVGLVDGIEDILVQLRREVQVIQVQVHGVAVENTHHHGLTVLGGQGVDTHIHAALAHLHHDTTILRHAALGNVHAGHHLHAGDNRVGQVHRRRGHLVQSTIHAVADLELLLEGLQVNIRGAFLDGLVNHEVHELDHGRRIGFLRAVLAADAHGVHLVQQVAHGRLGAAVAFLQAGTYLVVRRHIQVDVLPAGHAQVVHGLRVQGVLQAHIQALARAVFHRQGSVQTRLRGCQLAEGLLRRGEALQRDVLGAHLGGNHVPEILRRADNAEVNQRLPQVLAAVGHLFLDVLGNRLLEHAVVDKNLKCYIRIHIDKEKL